jgi:hypothetical protein
MSVYKSSGSEIILEAQMALDREEHFLLHQVPQM